MTLSWCVIHDSGWQDNGCFAAEVAEHGDTADCQMVEMELHPAGTRVVTGEALDPDALRQWLVKVDSTTSLIGYRRYGLTDAVLINDLIEISKGARSMLLALAQSKDAP